ncbi:MAG TPA: rod shape-determining protein MreC [Saprospiraceae bacterium]|nr:rod shape-determining protein MreC [Saprospiraceae bacterium]
MQNLIQFLLRTGALFLFIGLELICFSLIIRKNDHQRQLYFQYSSAVTGRISAQFQSFIDYWSLREESDSLLNENARLRHLLYQSAATVPDAQTVDSTLLYHIIPARVIKNSVNARNNYVVLDQGSDIGIHRGMGVLHDDGPVGIVIATSRRFSKVLSILHSQAMVSAAIKRNHYFGSLVWRSSNPQIMRLEAVPKHADLRVGDTIVTSGQSVVFPRDIMIGIVDTFWIERGSSFYSIDVALNLDISRINHAYIIDYTWAAEVDTLDLIQ